MLDVFEFYLQQLSKVFKVLDSWEIFPGVSYLYFLIAVMFILVFIKLISFGLKDDFQNAVSFENFRYKGKHSPEYVAKHGKTGLKLRKRS